MVEQYSEGDARDENKKTTLVLSAPYWVFDMFREASEAREMSIEDFILNTVTLEASSILNKHKD